MKVIAAFAQLANGKDELCNSLVKKLGGEWERSAFANAVKNVYAQSFGVTREFIEEWKRKDEVPPGMLMPVRKGLQFIGDGFRQIKGDIWIDIALRDKTKQLIISDGRYINEARHVKDNDGITILLWRPGYENDDPNPSESQIKPMIEWCAKTKVEDGPIPSYQYNAPPQMKHFDLFIRNDGTLEDLDNKIDKIILPYTEKKWSAQ